MESTTTIDINNPNPYVLLQGDSLEVLKTLPDGFVNTIVTSPPYYGLRDYGGLEGQVGREDTPEEYVQRLVDVFHECRRILRDDGNLWLNLGDSYCGNCSRASNNGRAGFGNPRETVVKRTANECKPKDMIGIPWLVAFALRRDGWYLRQDIIWEKPNPLPSSVNDRCSSSHEYVFLLSKSEKYYFNVEAIEEPANYDGRKDTMMKRGIKYADDSIDFGQTINSMASKGHERWKFRKFGGTKYPGSECGVDGTYSGRNWEPKLNGDMIAVRRKRDVWCIPTHPFKGAHFATYPEKLVEPCVFAGCPIGGIVLDPFNGSGTTGVVAVKNHRRYIGIDLNPEYIDIARKRIDTETSQTDFLLELGVVK